MERNNYFSILHSFQNAPSVEYKTSVNKPNVLERNVTKSDNMIVFSASYVYVRYIFMIKILKTFYYHHPMMT